MQYIVNVKEIKMKNLLLLLIFSVFVISCSESEYETLDIDKNSISVYDDMLQFENMSQFRNILEDYYKNKSLYEEKLTRLNNVLTGNKAYLDFMDKIESKNWDSEEQLKNYIIENISNAKFTGDEIMPIFDMEYKNAFCNVNGLVRIGDYIYKYNNVGRYKLSLEIYKNEGFDINNENITFESFQTKTKSDNIDIRTDVGGTCTDIWDNRRIKCKSEIEFTSDNGINCETFYFQINSESKNRFQRKRLGIWWNVKADYLSIESIFSILSSDGQIVFYDPDFAEASDAYSVELNSIFYFCVDCNLTYSLSNYEYDFFGNNNDVSFSCEVDLDMGGEQDFCP